MKIAVPLKSWQDRFAGRAWVVRIEPTQSNGLKRVEAADVMQVRSLDTGKFLDKVGRLSANEMEGIVAALPSWSNTSSASDGAVERPSVLPARSPSLGLECHPGRAGSG